MTRIKNALLGQQQSLQGIYEDEGALCYSSRDEHFSKTLQFFDLLLDKAIKSI